jgi:hypothetical protein
MSVNLVHLPRVREAFLSFYHRNLQPEHGFLWTGGRMENQLEPANGLEQLARQSFDFLCWIEGRVVWPLVISPSLLVGFLTVVLMRRGRSSGF